MRKTQINARVSRQSGTTTKQMRDFVKQSSGDQQERPVRVKHDAQRHHDQNRGKQKERKLSTNPKLNKNGRGII